MFVWLLWFATVGLSLVVIGQYERRIRALERHPRTQVRLVPRTYYDEQLGVRWSTSAADAAPAV